MSDAYGWFKFNCAKWMMGRIQRLSFTHHGAFMRVCSVYWTKQGELSLEDAEIECTKNLLFDLMELKIIKSKEGMISIGFLDEQLEDVKGKSKQNSNAAKVRWDNERNATAMQPHSERNAERKKEREKEDNMVPAVVEVVPQDEKFYKPSENEVIEFYGKNGYAEHSAKHFFSHYQARGWNNKNDSPVEFWKVTAHGWFKDADPKTEDELTPEQKRIKSAYGFAPTIVK